MFLRLLLFVFILSLVGCASMGNPKVADFNPQTQIEYGKTTKTQLKEMLGEPNGIKYGADGKETWVFIYAEGQARPATFIPIVGLFAGGSDVSAKKLIFAFDEMGVLQKEGSGEAKVKGTSRRKMRRFIKEEE